MVKKNNSYYVHISIISINFLFNPEAKVNVFSIKYTYSVFPIYYTKNASNSSTPITLINNKNYQNDLIDVRVAALK